MAFVVVLLTEMAITGCAPEDHATSLRRAAILNPERGTDKPVIGSAHESQAFAAAASRGGESLVVWMDSRRRDIYSADIYGARVTATGDVVDPTGFPIVASEDNETDPNVVWNGSTYFVVWSAPAPVTGPVSDMDIFAGRVSWDGVPLDATPIHLATVAQNQRYPKVAWNGTEHLVVWENDGDAIQGVRVDRDGRVLDAKPIVISHPTYRDLTPAVATDGHDFLVVWEDNEDRDIAGAVVLANGTLGNAKDIQIAHVAGNQMEPMVVWAGAAYVVAWTDSRPELVNPNAADAIYGARVGSDGQVHDVRGIPFFDGPLGFSYPSLASDGKRAWLTWNDPRTGPSGRYGNFIESTGPIADTSGQLVIPSFSARSQIAQFAWAGTQYLGLFSRTVETRDSLEVVIRRFSASGADLDMTDRQVSHAANRQMEATIASNGQGYLMAWVDDRDDEGDIYAARLDGSGRVLDDPAIALSRAPRRQRAPSAVWNGTDYVVSWFDPELGGSNEDLVAVRIGTDGHLRDTTPIALAKTGYGVDEVPQLAWSGSDTFTWIVFSDGAVRALRLSRDGSVLDTTPLRLSPANGHWAYRPTIGCVSGSCLAAWSDSATFVDSADIVGVRLGSDGKAIDPMPMTLVGTPGQQTSPRLQAHGGGYLLAYADGARDNWNLDLYATLLAADGSTTKAPFLIAESKGERPFTAAVWTGTHFLVAWDQYSQQSQNPGSDIFAARISDTGTLVDQRPQTFVHSRYADRQPVLASFGDGTAAVGYWRFDDSDGLGAERVKLRFFDNTPEPDGGVPEPDSGRRPAEAGPNDVAVAAPPDAAVVDGSADRAPVDLAPQTPDAVVVADAGAPRDASPDAATVDAQVPVSSDAAPVVETMAARLDAMPADAQILSLDGSASSVPDAAVPAVSSGAKSKAGCSCQVGDAGGSSAGFFPALALALGLLRSRRRR